MSFRSASFFPGFRRSQQIHLGPETPLCPDLKKELEDLRKFSLNSLMIFLGIHLVAGSKTLRPLTLALLIYTISLHLAISASFLQNCPTLSKFLHAVPFLGISCMAVVELVIDVKSPALAAGALFLGVLPPIIIAIYHARWCAEMASIRLPVRVREVPSPAHNPTTMTAMSS